MPASSPARRSTTSALKPARSAQRRYMRMRIWAQSCDSVPPAPGWMDTMAFFRSCGPDRVTFSSNASSAAPARCRPSWISVVMLSSPASVAISHRRRASSAWRTRSLKVPSVRASSARSCTSPWARRVSSQKLAFAISPSMAARRASFPATSKMAPEVVQPLLQLRDVALQIPEHAVRDLRKSANPRTLAPRPRQP